ncbi:MULTISPECIES: hypothetical protein [Leuconostoc]|uniref:Uncharacterized protein n=1 Tax=Leuconostoc carnosum (strain JB16) TaxID=1229758 RepID=K0D8C6_LEUCJ|nr:MULTISPECIES: hypothetical protein [Leuconostoc]AFT82189.1 hypothetical protein C270_06400 [Leuconostoc carnosum JB16]MBB6432844.1 putative membrane protein [Leuconostoc carnosum]MDV8936653.1 hypothetical protein [Leuconostoc sp.]WLC59785.1 hypothetical protein HTZ88_07285 [Leuconostoc carnosum]WLC97513.1 hypothetical protein Q5R05_07595 [Leuconostoc carnosum]
MKKSSVYVVILALILMFVSLVSWIMNESTFAILASNLGLLILAISYIWDNRNGLMK